MWEVLYVSAVRCDEGVQMGCQLLRIVRPSPQHRVLYGVVDACLNLLVEQQVVCELESSTHTGLV